MVPLTKPRLLRSLLASAGLFVVLAGSSLAHAADAISDEARTHFKAGVSLLQDPEGERVEEAYREFKAAYAISKSPKILGNMGFCAMRLERDGEAISRFDGAKTGAVALDRVAIDGGSHDHRCAGASEFARGKVQRDHDRRNFFAGLPVDHFLSGFGCCGLGRCPTQTRRGHRFDADLGHRRTRTAWPQQHGHHDADRTAHQDVLDADQPDAPSAAQHSKSSGWPRMKPSPLMLEEPPLRARMNGLSTPTVISPCKDALPD